MSAGGRDSHVWQRARFLTLCLHPCPRIPRQLQARTCCPCSAARQTPLGRAAAAPAAPRLRCTACRASRWGPGVRGCLALCKNHGCMVGADLGANRSSPQELHVDVSMHVGCVPSQHPHPTTPPVFRRPRRRASGGSCIVLKIDRWKSRTPHGAGEGGGRAGQAQAARQGNERLREVGDCAADQVWWV